MKNIDDDKPICIREVNENLRRVRLGQELTRPLKQLNAHCEFRKKYDEAFDIWEADKIEKERKEKLARRREQQRKYKRKKLNIPKERWRVK